MSESEGLANEVFKAEMEATIPEYVLTEMDRAIPSASQFARIAPNFQPAGRGRCPLLLENMKQIYILWQRPTERSF
ncbi:MAG: hypothetical protein IT355_17645 [Gemmatimonadaceae bacterium]|nr:hypothetical protein [Gemmatimonadaceae bacterium]